MGEIKYCHLYVTRREPCTHIQSSGMLPWKPQRSPNKSSHISASLQQSALLIQLQESSCLFFAVCSHLSAPQCRFWLPLKPILWSQSWMVHMALRRNILEFFPPVPSSAAQPGHSICFTLQWPFFPCSFMLQNKFLLQDRHFSSLKCSICSWPEPMGPTPSAGLNQPKTRLKQVRKIRLHPQNLTFTSGLVHITWCLQFSRKLSLYYKLVIYFRGQGGVSSQTFPAQQLCAPDLQSQQFHGKHSQSGSKLWEWVSWRWILLRGQLTFLPPWSSLIRLVGYY